MTYRAGDDAAINDTNAATISSQINYRSKQSVFSKLETRILDDQTNKNSNGEGTEQCGGEPEGGACRCLEVTRWLFKFIY